MNTGVRGRSEVAPMPAPAQTEDPGATSSPRPFSPGLPPSYDEALQHRTVEYGYACSHDQYYGGPPPPLPSHRHMGYEHGPNCGIERMPDDGESRGTGTADEDTERCMKMTLPPMHMCMAVTCLIFNFIIPGFGTMLAAFGVFCCTKGNEWTASRRFGACCLNFSIGVAQLVLTPLLLIGWIWSILWGFAFVGVSSEAYHGRKRTTQATTTPNAGQQTCGMAAVQRTPRQAETSDQLQVQPAIHALDSPRDDSNDHPPTPNDTGPPVPTTNAWQSNSSETGEGNAPAPPSTTGSPSQ